MKLSLIRLKIFVFKSFLGNPATEFEFVSFFFVGSVKELLTNESETISIFGFRRKLLIFRFDFERFFDGTHFTQAACKH